MFREVVEMTQSNKFIILFNLRYYRMRINKQSFFTIGYPKRIRLLIHPERKELVIQPCNKYETLSFKVPNDFNEDNHGFELNSIKLTEMLADDIGWDMNKSYRIYGRYVEKENVVVFPLNEYEIATQENDL